MELNKRVEREWFPMQDTLYIFSKFGISLPTQTNFYEPHLYRTIGAIKQMRSKFKHLWSKP